LKKALLATLKNIPDLPVQTSAFAKSASITTSSNSDIDSKGDIQHCLKLDAFIHKVHALEGKKIDSEFAATLIDMAESIKERFGCNIR
jgi:hypothetical protein